MTASEKRGIRDRATLAVIGSTTLNTVTLNTTTLNTGQLIPTTINPDDINTATLNTTTPRQLIPDKYHTIILNLDDIFISTTYNHMS